MTNLSELLEPIASQFQSMGIPEPIVHWGHPGMMGIVIFANLGTAALCLLFLHSVLGLKLGLAI